jgi:peroxiredoxin
MSQLAIGIHAPDFELNTADGRPGRLSQALQKGPVVLVFYKGECPTCQFTFPFIQQIYSKMGPSAPWTLWGISEDDPEETRAFARQHGITFDLLIDDYPYAVSAAYGLQSVPAIFIVQRDGTINLSEFGFSKSALNQIAGFEFFTPGDGLPEARPG